MENNPTIKIIKTESIEEFLARGGKISKVKSKIVKTKTSEKVVVELEPIHMGNLPKELRKKYGCNAG